MDLTTAVVDGDDPHDGNQGPHRHHPAVTHPKAAKMTTGPKEHH